MEKIWYLARGDRVIGLYSDSEVGQFAAAGHLAATDMILRTGAKDWRPIKEFCDQTTGKQDAPMVEIPVTCFVCYQESAVTWAAENTSIACPHCGSLMEAVSPPADEIARQRAFAGLGGSLTERIQQKMNEAYAAEAEQNAIFGKMLKAILRESLR